MPLAQVRAETGLNMCFALLLGIAEISLSAVTTVSIDSETVTGVLHISVVAVNGVLCINAVVVGAWPQNRGEVKGSTLNKSEVDSINCHLMYL